MGLLKDLVDRMLTPDLDTGGGRSIEEAILLEHARSMDELGTFLSSEINAEPSLDEMARSLEANSIDIELSDFNASVLSAQLERGISSKPLN
jgi:hypothetical protein